MEKKPEFIPTRESLLSRLKDWDDDEGWSEFFKIYRQSFFATAIKSGLREHEAEEVVQETITSLLATRREARLRLVLVGRQNFAIRTEADGFFPASIL